MSTYSQMTESNWSVEISRPYYCFANLGLIGVRHKHFQKFRNEYNNQKGSENIKYKEIV